MTTKLIRLPLSRKIDFLCHVYFPTTSPVEKVILAELCRIGGNLSRSSEVVKAVRTGININESTFNVSISRMVKKGLLTKGENVLIVHPLFTGGALEEYLVRFEDEKKADQ